MLKNFGIGFNREALMPAATHTQNTVTPNVTVVFLKNVN